MTKTKYIPRTSRDSLDEIQRGLFDSQAALACAVHAFEASELVDKCEVASRACMVLRKSVQDLDGLHNRLDEWNVRFAPKQSQAVRG